MCDMLLVMISYFVHTSFYVKFMACVYILIYLYDPKVVIFIFTYLVTIDNIYGKEKFRNYKNPARNFRFVLSSRIAANFILDANLNFYDSEHRFTGENEREPEFCVQRFWCFLHFSLTGKKYS